ncbi:hypothetical protein BSK49_10935 [Paenibacillus odorifer]|uniref:hypothetical protein n=1 Tax=Paenibacillus TaxID=44249 RepID=UPI00096BFE6B|nr:hypothetical protein [Paenibacillus odorifer]OMD89874.1 hypothetical protein BSK49_10935 [Paenibacillus odorifer]OMD98754.1 hypothetical protein BSK64_27195 [Paenibacillus odorifer]
MDFLKLLPFPQVISIFGVFMLLVIVIDFFRTAPPARLLENSKTRLLRRIINELTIFIVITILILFFVSPHERPILMASLFGGVIITSILGLIYAEAKNSRLQLFINRLIIKIIGEKGFKFYRVGLSAAHTLLLLTFYIYYTVLITSGLKEALNFSGTTNFDIIYYAYYENKFVVYAFFILTSTMFFMFKKLYMSPINKIFKETFNKIPKVRIKLTSGEVLQDLYIFQTSDVKFIMASNEINISKYSKTYHIHKDKIDYIEANSDSKIIDMKQQNLKKI